MEAPERTVWILFNWRQKWHRVGPRDMYTACGRYLGAMYIEPVRKVDRKPATGCCFHCLDRKR